LNRYNGPASGGNGHPQYQHGDGRSRDNLYTGGASSAGGSDAYRGSPQASEESGYDGYGGQYFPQDQQQPQQMQFPPRGASSLNPMASAPQLSSNNNTGNQFNYNGGAGGPPQPPPHANNGGYYASNPNLAGGPQYPGSQSQQQLNRVPVVPQKGTSALPSGGPVGGSGPPPPPPKTGPIKLNDSSTKAEQPQRTSWLKRRFSKK
jgi:hypothetical protein